MEAGACVGAGGRGGGPREGGGGGRAPFVCMCGRVLCVRGGGRRGGGRRRRCYSRLPVNNARGECFMARAGL